MKSRSSRSSARDVAEDLSYGEARTALDLTLAQLQASDLDVEAMTDLFRRAQGYARRCESLLAKVEHEVLLWDAADADATPQPYQAEQTGSGPQAP
jgi:exodeoxyribonuclease VII small subunit